MSLMTAGFLRMPHTNGTKEVLRRMPSMHLVSEMKCMLQMTRQSPTRSTPTHTPKESSERGPLLLGQPLVEVSQAVLHDLPHQSNHRRGHASHEVSRKASTLEPVPQTLHPQLLLRHPRRHQLARSQGKHPIQAAQRMQKQTPVLAVSLAQIRGAGALRIGADLAGVQQQAGTSQSLHPNQSNLPTLSRSGTHKHVQSHLQQ